MKKIVLIIGLTLYSSCSNQIGRKTSSVEGGNCNKSFQTILGRKSQIFEFISDYFDQHRMGRKMESNSQYYGKCRGQRMYQIISKELVKKSAALKKGSFFYLDGLHKDHLEVFDKNGLFSYVVNFDGSINEKKSTQAYGQGRNIKNCL
jgi:transcription elongation factor Elf1